MPILDTKNLKSFVPPEKRAGRLRIGLSHEFVELYRGDKDLKVGKMLCNDYGWEAVHFGSNLASPADSRVFKTIEFPIDKVSGLPDNYYLLLLKSSIVFHRAGNISLGGFFRWSKNLYREVLRWKPDIIFENPYLTLTPRSYMTFSAARRLQIPIVYIDCGDIIPQLSMKHKLVLPIERRVVNKIDCIITYNEAGRKRFVSKYGYPSDKIRVIPKPIEISRFQAVRNAADFKARYQLDGKFVVAYFGRLSSNKGARYLLEAAKLINEKKSNSDIVFLFVGGNLEADQAAEFKELFIALNLKNIRLTGMIPNSEMPSAYAASDLAVFPDVTNLPGFSTVLAESMASGLSIIIGNKGWEDATPIVNGENGIVIKPRNPELLAEAIMELKNNDSFRKSLGAGALKLASEQMDYKKVVARYVDIFMQLIKGETNGYRSVIADIEIGKYESTAAG
jgi:glycosyltransferase involved in cell wall biosynthesis